MDDNVTMPTDAPENSRPARREQSGMAGTAELRQLRDQFAMAALAGIGTWSPTQQDDHDARAEWAYRQADAMLEARQK